MSGKPDLFTATLADLSDQLAETEARYAMTRLLLQAALDQIRTLRLQVERSQRWRVVVPDDVWILQAEADRAEALDGDANI